MSVWLDYISQKSHSYWFLVKMGHQTDSFRKLWGVSEVAATSWFTHFVDSLLVHIVSRRQWLGLKLSHNPVDYPPVSPTPGCVFSPVMKGVRFGRTWISSGSYAKRTDKDPHPFLWVQAHVSGFFPVFAFPYFTSVFPPQLPALRNTFCKIQQFCFSDRP